MSYLVLARKWRPLDFKQVVGQEHVSKTLANAIKQNRLAHALLFSGARGIGKTTTARILARCLNCQQGPTANPCGKCPSCQEISAAGSMDVIEIDGASNNKVENIREIIDNVRYLPGAGRNKIYIIDEVHMLSIAAFNALLKTLEEPPAKVYFVLATTEAHRLPATIISRCQRYDFRRISVGAIADHLAHLAAEEKISISKYALQTVASMAAGSMRDALSLFDQLLSYAGNQVSDQKLNELFALVDRKLLWQLITAVVEKQQKECLMIVNQIYSAGYDLTRLVREMSNIYRNLLAVNVLKDRSLCQVAEGEEQFLEEVAQKVTLAELLQQYELLRRSLYEIQRADNQLYAFEALLLKMTFAGPVLPVAEVLQRLEKIEATPLVAEEKSAPLKKKVNPAEQRQATTKEANLPQLIEAIQQKRPAIAAIIRAAKAELRKEQGVALLKLLVTEFEKKMINDPASLAAINASASESLGLPLSLDFAIALEGKKQQQVLPKKMKQGNSSKEEVLSDPAVKKVRKILEAEIINIEEQQQTKISSE